MPCSIPRICARSCWTPRESVALGAEGDSVAAVGGAAAIFARLGKDPILASRQLQTTLAGVVLLMETWLLLVGLLEPGKDWSESERSKALDLLGVEHDLLRRWGQTETEAAP